MHSCQQSCSLFLELRNQIRIKDEGRSFLSCHKIPPLAPKMTGQTTLVPIILTLGNVNTYYHNTGSPVLARRLLNAVRGKYLLSQRLSNNIAEVSWAKLVHRNLWTERPNTHICTSGSRGRLRPILDYASTTLNANGDSNRQWLQREVPAHVTVFQVLGMGVPHCKTGVYGPEH